jgi:hypothetical protein
MAIYQPRGARLARDLIVITTNLIPASTDAAVWQSSVKGGTHDAVDERARIQGSDIGGGYTGGAATANFQFSSFRGDAKHRARNDELALEASAA